MYNSSTQKKHWIFDHPESIAKAQLQANKSFTEVHLKRCKKYDIPPPSEFLQYHDEKLLLIYYSKFINDVCRKFKPPVPSTVIGTSIAYFKRFFLSTSVMEFHPREIGYLSVYLAMKVDEYNVSIDQFMEQVSSQPNHGLQMFIIDNELLMLQKLNFHLTVHCPYRPFEGLMIDLKTKKDQIRIEDVEAYRQKSEQFLVNSTLTDTALMYPPSQIALAALSYGIGERFMSYLQQMGNKHAVAKLIENIKEIHNIVVNFKFPSKNEIASIEEKLKHCQDPENNPNSDQYHARDNARKEAKEIQKRKKYQELSNIQQTEERMLAADMSISE